MAASAPGRLTVTLPVQAWSDTQRVSLHDLLTAGQFVHGPFGLALTDAGEATVRALLDLGARLAFDEAAGAEWSLRADFPGGEARIMRPLGATGSPVILVELAASPSQAEAFARGIHAHLGDSAFQFTDPRLLRRIAGEPEVMTRLWRTLLKRPDFTAGPGGEPARAAKEERPPRKEDPPRSEAKRERAAPTPPKPKGPPLDALASLGLTNEAVWDEIKRAYRKLALQLHPDRTGGNKALEAQFAQVNDAYGRLKEHYGK